MKKICIIGSGLSGLSCAHYLKKNNYQIKIFEKKSYPGGRANSEQVNGYTCDIGFQVLLNNYDELKKINIYKKLDMKYFNSGAEIYFKHKNLRLYNPLYHPIKAFKSNLAQIFSFRDIINIIFLILFKNPKRTKAGSYIDVNFNNKIKKYFLFPFFRGVFLSKNLDNELSFFIKLLRKFSFGRAGIPRKGMQELPAQIIKNMKLKIQHRMCLKKIDGKSVVFENGHREKFDKIILAMPIYEISKVLNINLEQSYNSNTTCYFSSSKKVLGKSILLIPDEKLETNSIQCLSNISSYYSTQNNYLYSLSTLEKNSSEKKLEQEFQEITGIKAKDISFIKKYNIKYALPREKIKIKNKNLVYFCGDWSEEPSIDGALKSGRLLAEKIISSDHHKNV